jgi:hypothetical protein
MVKSDQALAGESTRIAASSGSRFQHRDAWLFRCQLPGLSAYRKCSYWTLSPAGVSAHTSVQSIPLYRGFHFNTRGGRDQGASNRVKD